MLSATGVWTDELRELAGARSGTRIRPSKGIHVVVPRDRIPMETGVLMRTEKSVLFIIPWGPHWIIGDTDTAWELDRAHPAATGADIDYVLEKANSMLLRPLVRDDVEGVFVGLRPLVGSSESADTTRLSRAHTVETPVPGLTTIAGGKYTTYRVMAQDLVDAGRARPRRRSCRRRAPTQTPIVGASGYRARWNQRARIASATGLDVTRVERLLDRYGDRIDELADADRRAPRARPPARRCARVPRRSRSSTPARTRVRCASRTCSRAARGSRSRRAIAASPARPRSPS